MNTDLRQNYFEILNINENATPHEIHFAYEKAKRTYSADNKALAGIFTAEETAAFRELIEEAYQALSPQQVSHFYQQRMSAGVENSETPVAPNFEFQRAEVPVIEAIEIEEEVIVEEEEELIMAASTSAPVAEMVIETYSEAPIVNPTFENMIAAKRDWNGDDLKQVREYRKLSFDELTDITKINPWYIAALEKMDPANLPVEVFVRGYVLQVAKALGLKEKVVADSYMRLFRKKIEN
ncbi:MAG: helix-turn-helix domain-containing protein [Pseudobdellovibrio sp.]